MSTARLPLYQRLPEIYRIRDAEQSPPGQLEDYVGVMDPVFAAIRDNIAQMYHDQSIETCNDWVIPYIGDLLGTSHLAGDAWTLRADVARTIYHRRRKGTLGAIESLTFALSGFAVHTVELLERLVWNQHLNHQRPDEGGVPPLTLIQSISAPIRGGTVNLRDPALLSLLPSPFDPFAHVVDVKPQGRNKTNGDYGGYNLPNLAVFLWRLKVYTVPVSPPVFRAITDLTPAAAGNADFAVRFDLHPLGEPMVLFNTHRFAADAEPPSLTHLDAVPGPMPPPRLTQDTPAGRPDQYVQVRTYIPPAVPPEADNIGLTLYVPQAPFGGVNWKFRGANLCAWEAGLQPPLRMHEIAIDPERGRAVFGVGGANQTVEAEPLRDHLQVAATYGMEGPTGAHPVARPDRPATWLEQTPTVRLVSYHADPAGLQHALDDIENLTAPLIVEIQDSMTHDLDLSLVSGALNDGGLWRLQLGNALWIRAAAGERPVIRLARPLRFRPRDPTADLNVELEGLYLTRGPAFDANEPNGALIAGVALNQLFLDGCTLDPGGYVALNGTRAPIREAMRLDNHYGLSGADETAFDQTPEIVLHRCICGPLAIDDGYRLTITDGIVDAGSGVEATLPALALSATANPETNWGAPLTVAGVTFFGRVRAASASGRGGIFVHTLEVHDDQTGCIKFSYFTGAGNRLPQHHACVFGGSAFLSFVSEIFGAPGYAQLHGRSDSRILEQGPGYDAMGAFGYLQNAHKWKNIHIRYREFIPVGIRPVLILAT